MKKTPFVFQCFTSKNTAFAQEIPLAQSIRTARGIAIIQTLKGLFEKVVVSRGECFEEYENGEKVSWSYPEGLENS